MSTLQKMTLIYNKLRVSAHLLLKTWCTKNKGKIQVWVNSACYYMHSTYQKDHAPHPGRYPQVALFNNNDVSESLITTQIDIDCS